MFYFIEYLRAIATALIANSHFKGVYPNDILSFGGGYGLALFYMISGFLLASIHRETRFFKWYLPKIVRLYIPLFIVKVLGILVGTTKIDSLGSIIRNFVFPGTWFGASMVILYPVYFCLVKYWFTEKGFRRPAIVIGLSAACYCVLFFSRAGIATFSLETLAIESPFSIETPYLIALFVWLVCMMVGYLVRKADSIRVHRPVWIAGVVVSVAAFLLIKLMTRNGGHTAMQFFLGVVYVGFALSLFMIFQGLEQWCQGFWRCLW